MRRMKSMRILVVEDQKDLNDIIVRKHVMTGMMPWHISDALIMTE